MHNALLLSSGVSSPDMSRCEAENEWSDLRNLQNPRLYALPANDFIVYLTQTLWGSTKTVCVNAGWIEGSATRHLLTQCMQFCT